MANALLDEWGGQKERAAVAHLGEGAGPFLNPQNLAGVKCGRLHWQSQFTHTNHDACGTPVRRLKRWPATKRFSAPSANTLSILRPQSHSTPSLIAHRSDAAPVHVRVVAVRTEPDCSSACTLSNPFSFGSGEMVIVLFKHIAKVRGTYIQYTLTSSKRPAHLPEHTHSHTHTPSTLPACSANDFFFALLPHYLRIYRLRPLSLVLESSCSASLRDMNASVSAADVASHGPRRSQ